MVLLLGGGATLLFPMPVFAGRTRAEWGSGRVPYRLRCWLAYYFFPAVLPGRFEVTEPLFMPATHFTIDKPDYYTVH